MEGNLNIAPAPPPPDTGAIFSLEDCIKAATTIGMPEEMILEFFNHYAAVGWIDAAGRRITNLPAAMAKWKAKQPSYGLKTSRYEPEQITHILPEK